MLHRLNLTMSVSTKLRDATLWLASRKHKTESWTKFGSKTTQLRKMSLHQPGAFKRSVDFPIITALLKAYLLRLVMSWQLQQASWTLLIGLLALTKTTEIVGALATQSTFSSPISNIPSSKTHLSLNCWARQHWQRVELHCSHSYWCEHQTWDHLKMGYQPLLKFKLY